MQKQNSKCAVCNINFDFSKVKSIHVDHEHITNKVRGILCKDCNTGLGHFKDNPEFLYKAGVYLTPKVLIHMPQGV